MASMGSGRKERLGFIESLRASEVEILKCLLLWDHNSKKASPYIIASKIEISTASVVLGLRYLRDRGIVRKSPNGSWFIVESIKKDLKSEVYPNDSKQNAGVQHTLDSNPEPSRHA